MVHQQREDDSGDRAVEEPKPGGKEDAKTPRPAGPHADPSLTNDEATPGAGTLPDPDGKPDSGGSVSS